MSPYSQVGSYQCSRDTYSTGLQGGSEPSLRVACYVGNERGGMDHRVWEWLIKAQNKDEEVVPKTVVESATFNSCIVVYHIHYALLG
jgi:hypothetical protein